MIAFLIASHNDPAATARLIERLKPHDVFVHLDAKVDDGPEWDPVRPHLIAERVPVYWGGFSQVAATAALIRAALGSGRDYSRLVLLSGSCYPCRPIAELERLFDADPARNFIRLARIESGRPKAYLTERAWRPGPWLPWRWARASALVRRLDHWAFALHHRTIGRLRRLRWRHPYQRYHGSSWWALTPAAARLALAAFESDAALAAAYARALAADEQFFHTVIGNSPLAGTVTEVIDRPDHRVADTANLHLIDPTLTRWFVAEDYDEIAASSAMFVRKVRTGPSDGLLDRLDERIGYRPTGR